MTSEDVEQDTNAQHPDGKHLVEDLPESPLQHIQNDHAHCPCVLTRSLCQPKR